MPLPLLLIIAVAGEVAGGWFLSQLSAVLHGDERTEAEITDRIAETRPDLMGEWVNVMENNSNQEAQGSSFGFGELGAMLPFILLIIAISFIKK